MTNFLNEVTTKTGVDGKEILEMVTEETIEKIRSVNAEFLSSMTEMARVCESMKNVRMLTPTVTTITITGKVSFDEDVTKELPIDYIRESLDVENNYGLYIGVPKTKKKRTGVFTKKVEHDKRKFRHQVSINHDGKSAKLFYNGSIHATGCTSILDFVCIVIHISKFISDITSGDLKLKLSDFKINMINTSSLVMSRDKYPMVFPPKTLTELMRNERVNVDFDPERHPGVKIVLMDGKTKVSTGCVFQTGSITIIGSKAPNYVAMIFKQIADNLDKFYSIASSSKKLRTTTALKPLSLSHGYLENSYNICI